MKYRVQTTAGVENIEAESVEETDYEVRFTLNGLRTSFSRTQLVSWRELPEEQKGGRRRSIATHSDQE